MSSSKGFDLELESGLRRSIYLAAFMLVVMPLVQALSGLLPLNPGSVEWRLRASTTMSGVLMVPFAGLVVIFALGKYTESKGATRFVGIAALLCTAILLIADPLFVLDAFQYKSIVKSQVIEAYNRTMVITGITMLLYTLIYGFLGFSAFRAPKAVSKQAMKGAKKPAESAELGLLIGQEFGEKK